MTYRFRGHSMSDPGLYRTKDEVEEWKQARSAHRSRASACSSVGVDEDELVALEDDGQGRRSRRP